MTTTLPHKARTAVALYMLIYADYLGESEWAGLQLGFFREIEQAKSLPRRKLYGFLKLCGWQWRRTRWHRIKPGNIQAAFELLYGKVLSHDDPIHWD